MSAKAAYRWAWVLRIVRIYVVVLFVLTLIQRTLVFVPTVDPRVASRATNLHLPVVDVTLVVDPDDSATLHGWVVLAESQQQAAPTPTETAETPAEPAEEPIAKPQPIASDPPAADRDAPRLISAADGFVVLYFPGNAGNRSYRDRELRALNACGATTVIFDYRGYGDSTGHANESAITNDARRIWDYLTHDLQISPGRIVIYGESLGGGPATRLAAEASLAGQTPAGLIVQSTYDRLVTPAQQRFFWLPVSQVLLDRFPSVEWMPQVQASVLHIHGDADTVVPLSCGQRLFDAAPAESAAGIPKTQLILHGADHFSVYRSPRRGAQSQLKGLFSDLRAARDAGHLLAKPAQERLSERYPPAREDLAARWIPLVTIFAVLIGITIWIAALRRRYAETQAVAEQASVPLADPPKNG